MLLVSSSTNLLLLKKSVEFLLSYHDILRCRYNRYEKIGGDDSSNNDNNSNKSASICWNQMNLGVVTDSISSIWHDVDLSNTVDSELADTIEKHSNKAQVSLNIEYGPIVKVVLFNCGTARPARLLIVIHHLAVDGVSWRILLEDLERVYKNLEEGFDLASIAKTYIKTHSYKQWSNALLEYAKSSEVEKQISYWKEIEEGCRAITLPQDFEKQRTDDDIDRDNDLYQSVFLSLNEAETLSLLQSVPKAYRTEINDILLTALTLAVGDWTGKYKVSLSLEGHGREDIGFDIDTSRTVGWFTTIFPVYLDVSSSTREHDSSSITDIDLDNAIKTIKEELRRVPNKGIGYGVLAYLRDDLSDKGNVNTHLHPSINFNYLGQWDNVLQKEGLFTFASESSGESISSENKDSYLLNINSEVKQGSFGISFGYNSSCYSQETIEKVGNLFIARLRQIIEHCTSEGIYGYTPKKRHLNHNYNVVLKYNTRSQYEVPDNRVTN